LQARKKVDLLQHNTHASDNKAGKFQQVKTKNLLNLNHIQILPIKFNHKVYQPRKTSSHKFNRNKNDRIFENSYL